MVVGGEGQAVGVAGGYVLGAGHSPLSSIYGMAADQVLSMEVVLPNGRSVTAFTENTGLFWALRGSGGSTFGVITSVTIKAYPTIPATTSTFTWTTGPKSNITHGRFWAGLHAYLDLFIEHSDADIYSFLHPPLQRRIHLPHAALLRPQQNHPRDPSPPKPPVPTPPPTRNNLHPKDPIFRQLLLRLERLVPARSR